MNRRDDRELFSRHRPPRAPDDLKEHVLRSAIGALEGDTSVGVWDRIWESRSLRVVWAVATMALIVAHVLISSPPGSSQRRSSAVETARGQMEALRGLLDLPSVEISPRAEALVMGRRRNQESNSRDNARKNEVPS